MKLRFETYDTVGGQPSLQSRCSHEVDVANDMSERSLVRAVKNALGWRQSATTTMDYRTFLKVTLVHGRKVVYIDLPTPA